MMGSQLGNRPIPSLPDRHYAQRRQKATNYSSEPQGDGPGPSAHHHTAINQLTDDEKRSRRYGRLWDPTEVTEALGMLAPEARSNYYADTPQYARFHPALNRNSIYLIRGRKPDPKFSFASEVLPNDRVGFTTNHQSQPVTSSIPHHGTKIQYSAPTCSICFDDTNDFPRRGPTSRCTHPSAICTPCLREYLSHSILTDGSTSIICPIPQCDQIIEYNDVILGAKDDQACLNRYEALLLRRVLEKDPNFVWCKNPACSWGQIHEGGDETPLVICEQCYTPSCFTHDIPWHSGFTCRQFEAERRRLEERDSDNRESENYIRNHAKKCPSCGCQIQKNGGCNHMTCRRPVGCGHEFCWLCLANWGDHHKPGCEYYFPNIIPSAASSVVRSSIGSRSADTVVCFLYPPDTR